MVVGGVVVRLVEAAGTGRRGRGVARGLVLMFLQPLWTRLAKLLTQLKQVQSTHVLLKELRG